MDWEKFYKIYEANEVVIGFEKIGYASVRLYWADGSYDDFKTLEDAARAIRENALASGDTVNE